MIHDDFSPTVPVRMCCDGRCNGRQGRGECPRYPALPEVVPPSWGWLPWACAAVSLGFTFALLFTSSGPGQW